MKSEVIKMGERDIVSFDALLDRIGIANRGEMDDILCAIRKRHRELFCDDELVLAVIPKYDKQKRIAFWKWLLSYVGNVENSVG